MISMLTSGDSVGLFIRAPHYGSHEETRARLLLHSDRLAEELGVEMSDSNKYFFGQEKRGDYTDVSQRDELIDWLNKTATKYEDSLRSVLSV